MPPKRASTARRIQLLRDARKKIVALTKLRFRKQLPGALRRMDREATRVRRRVAAGTVTRKRATRSLRQLDKLRREGTRLLATMRTTAQQALAAVDHEIARLQGKR